MADQPGTLRDGGPEPSARSLDITKIRVSRRLLVDRLARRLVSFSGVTVIVVILAILFVIASEVYPLIRKPTARLVGITSAAIGLAPLALGVDEYREITYLAADSGVEFVSVKEDIKLLSVSLPELGDATVVAVSESGDGPIALGLSDGRVIAVEVDYSISFPEGIEGERLIEPDPVVEDPITVDPGGRPIKQFAYVLSPDGPLIAAVVAPRELSVVTVVETKALIGPGKKEEIYQILALPIEDDVTELIIDERGEDLFVGTSSGQVVRVNVREPGEAEVVGITSVTSAHGIGVSVMGFLIGDRTLVVGDEEGAISSWQLLRREDGSGFHLTKIYDFEPHGAPIVAFASSRRDKGFVAADSSGNINLYYGTTGRTLLSVSTDGGVETLHATSLAALTFSPKADGIIAADSAGRLFHWAINNPHPEITWRSLFGKVWYESYESPEYVWQSTGGTDDFEAKFSLAPLIFGTLKGTFYALLFAVPLALFGALYSSQFMHPTLKGYVKPVVEIMAALPSVVLGFIAGLWLAPMVERVVPGLFIMPLVVSGLILLSLTFWRFSPSVLRKWLRPGSEVFLLIPIVLIGGWLSLRLGAVVETWALSGDYRSWLLSVFGLNYDQRNSLVVGFAMGFAVVPIIFTIAEDSLSNVPGHLTAASLALGANRWQTAIRVVLPTASPGIFSAIMIGLGRAVGETMIVLMATGNTPVMDWSIFNGFRALSANIAVELPEAPVGATLFRILFLAAFILFIMTFIVNTAAELVRLRLRKRYSLL